MSVPTTQAARTPFGLLVEPPSASSLFDSDPSLECCVCWIVVIVKPADARQVQGARIATLARLQQTNSVDRWALRVDVNRIGKDHVRLRVVVDERHVAPRLDAHFFRRDTGCANGDGGPDTAL